MVYTFDCLIPDQCLANVKYCLQRERARKGGSRHQKSHKHDDEDDELHMEEEGGQHQCFGPQCVQYSRPDSKYCSDECGLKLATK